MNPPNRGVIRLNDRTSHGGMVTQVAAQHTTVGGRPLARVGDACFCPVSGHKACVIVEGNPDHTIDGIPVAYHGHKTSCGATLISTAATHLWLVRRSMSRGAPALPLSVIALTLLAGLFTSVLNEQGMGMAQYETPHDDDDDEPEIHCTVAASRTPIGARRALTWTLQMQAQADRAAAAQPALHSISSHAKFVERWRKER